MESPLHADLTAVDTLLAGAGLRHGRRRVASGRQPAPDPVPAPAVEPVFDLRISGLVEFLQARPLGEMPWLMHGFSTRRSGQTTAYRPDSPGELNLGETSADPTENVAANRLALVRAVAADDPHTVLVPMRQIHSTVIYRVEAAADGPFCGDGLMTGTPGLMLAIQTADCIPVLVADRRTRAVAAFHAGWRGTLKRIVQNGVGRMRVEFGSRPQDLVAAIGPGIGPCCYAVGEEVRSQFESQFAYAPSLFSEVYDSDPVKEKYPLLFMTARAPGHSNIGPSLHLDLPEANRRQLLDAGLAPGAIHLAGACTACQVDRFFSYRAERGFCGRMMSVIGVRAAA